MFIKPLTPIFKDRPEVASMSYLGLVEDNEDPEKLGRLKVRIEPFSDYSTDDLPWVSPTLSTSGNSPGNCALNIPEVGSQVRVFFPSQDLTAPYYTGAELNELNKTTFFDDDYPNTYGYRDSKGNFVRVNKAQATIHLQHETGTNFKVSDAGDVQLELKNGPIFGMDNMLNFVLSMDSDEGSESSCEIGGNGQGDLSIDLMGNLDIKANELLVDSPYSSFNGDVSFKNGASGVLYGFGWIAFVKEGLIVSIRPFGS